MNPESSTLQPLPIAARPHAGDSIEAYIQRLARANHLSYLRRLLLNNPYALYGGSIDLDRLAAMANRHPDSLRRALQPTPSRRAPARSSQSTAGRQPRKQADSLSCSPRSASSPTGKCCPSGHWPSGSQCIGAPSAKP